MLSQLSIAKKLSLGFAFILFLLIAIGLFGIVQMRALNAVSYDIKSNWLPGVNLSNSMNTATSDFRIAELQHILSTDAAEMQGREKEVAALREKIETNLRTYLGVISGPEERKIYDQAAEFWAKYLVEHENLIKLSRSNQNKEALALLRGKSQELFDLMSGKFSDLSSFNEKNADLVAEKGEKDYEVSLWTVLTLIAAALAIGTALAVFCIRSITLPILEAVNRLTKGSDLVATASAQISSAGTELSASATEQASALQETVASVDEISAMVSRNADNASKSQQIALESRDTSASGKEAVDQMIQSIDEISRSNGEIMKQIETSNREIAEIVTLIGEIGNKTKVINDIVFQTKLLSFNASVEAARAGEHGKGFAVVAEEVGNLAAMSGNAAKEISEMLDGSTKRVDRIVSDMKSKIEVLVNSGRQKVESGTEIAQRCGSILNSIVANVTEVNQMVGEISTASKEQSQGVAEISKAMAQLDQVTQQNASAAEESSSASEALSAQAEELRQIVIALVKTVQGSGAEIRPAGSSGSNVLALNEQRLKRAAKQTPALKGTPRLKMAAGSDLPSAEDARFEDV